ncbi:MAG: Asp-tRNA(Asn)/Glu-tRNA(Gln) amidotransferase subunit GatA [Nitrospinota bacterium]|nr:MAG: Asp-tRNA(Asn)/Glu-tRNA(Gln) amidotransferase subunit GatA [Nitrospinota bacterium]
MTENELMQYTIGKLASLFQARALSPVEVTQALLARIDRLDKRVNAFITVLAEQALEAARDAEAAIMRGDYRGPLHGIPFAVKDIFATQGVRTTCASKVWPDRIFPVDATVIERLQQAGAVLLGKLNMHEFAMGATSTSSHYGPVRNPWDLERVPGGSSGGSAAAIAATLALGTLGTDTGGSVRIPASLCGIVGLKPTYGRVSRHGVVTLSWSLDHVGPMTRTVEDAALMLQVMAGKDPQDPTTSSLPVPDYRAALEEDLRGITLGIPTDSFFTEVDAEVESAVSDAVQLLQGLGAAVEAISLPHIELAHPVGTIISSTEAYTYHEPFLQRQVQDYQPDVRDRLLIGASLLASDYVRAQQYRNLFRREVSQVMRRVDAIVTPTTPIPAPKIGEKTVTIRGKEEEVLKILSRLTRPWNLTGQPVISLPCGFTQSGLPIGLQIVGKAFAETTILRIAHAYERHTPWHEQRPAL